MAEITLKNNKKLWKFGYFLGFCVNFAAVTGLVNSASMITSTLSLIPMLKPLAGIPWVTPCKLSLPVMCAVFAPVGVTLWFCGENAVSAIRLQTQLSTYSCQLIWKYR